MRFSKLLFPLCAALLTLPVVGRPAQAQPAEEAPSAPASRLADPAIAEQVKLTDEQRMQFAALVTERAAALAKAPAEERDAVAKSYDDKLLAVLTEEQRQSLDEAAPAADAPQVEGQQTQPEGEQPKLRFNFRFQRWTDVLDWFAEQAGLSLVLDAPPPGTFNYSDKREYTVPESLDLLNGVLLTKGYTLIRRDRMLILVDLSQGLPETLVPRVTMEELDQRGRYEIVSVLFSVGGRDAAEVVAEVSPLLTPRGKSQPLPQTRQVLITDTAGVMRAIDAVIESMPEPKKRQEEKPEKPQLVVYPLKTADPDAAVQVLEALMPDARFVRDPQVNQISAYATPTQQAAVKNVIDQMQATSGPDEDRARFEVYPLEDIDPAGSLATLQPLVPAARLSIDPVSKKLAAWGSPADHDILKKAVEQLGGGTLGVDDRQVEVYRLAKADPSSTMAVLQNVVPRARLAVDTPTKSIVAVATLDEQKTIRATLNQIESQKPPGGAAELRFYPLGQAPSATLPSTLLSLVPQATVTPDTERQRLAVVATPDDHATIKAAIDEYLKGAAESGSRQLVIYPVSSAERQRFQAVLARLTTEFPNVKIVTDAQPGELAVWADPEQHKVIAGIIEQVKQQPATDSGFRLVAYPIRSADPSGVMTVLQTMFPATRLVLDSKSRRLVAFTSPAEHESIESLIDQMDDDESGGWQNELMVYPVTGFEPSAAIATLRSLAPEATLTNDTKANTIVVWARKSDQQQIAAALERMTPAEDASTRPRVVSYSVGSSNPNVVFRLIATLVPTARVVPDEATGTIAVWASPEDHVTVAGAIEEMTGEGSAASATKVQVYTLEHVDASDMIRPLQTAAPQAQIGAGRDAQKLVVSARPAEHEIIKQTLAELDTDALSRQTVKVYPVSTGDGRTMLTTLLGLFGRRSEVRLSLDPDTRNIVASASPAEHETIRRVIEEIERGSLDKQAEFQVHALGDADPDMVRQVLRDLINKKSRAMVSVDAGTNQLAAVAAPEEQQMIAKMLSELQGAGRRLEVFQLELVEPSAAEVAIQNLFAQGGRRRRTGEGPSVQADGMSSRLYVRAADVELAEIRDLLVKMGETHLASGERSGTLRIIPFSGDTRALLDEIERVWPRLSSHPLRVISTPSDAAQGHSPLPGEIRRLPLPPRRLEEPAKAPAGKPAAPQKQSSRTDRRGEVEVLTAAYQPEENAEQDAAQTQPEAKDQPQPQKAAEPPAPQAPAPIIVSPGDGQITIMSDDPEAIQQFESLLRALAPPSGAGGRDVMVYPLTSANSSTVAELLKRIFRSGAFDFGDGSTPVVEADQRLNAVVVYAGRNDRGIIERVLKQLDTDEVPEYLQANRPVLIPVKHTDAAGIEAVLRDIYQTQLTRGAPNPEIPIPSNASRDVAAIIQQINTAASGPLMTLGVDEATNSIVVMAPGPLAQEIAELVAELDEAALNDTSRSVKVVRLKSTSAEQVREVLDDLIRGSTQSRGRGRRRR